MPKRLYEEDGRATPDGNSFAFKIKRFIEELALEAVNGDFDLRDLQGLVHDGVDGSIHLEILNNRRIKEGLEPFGLRMRNMP